MRILVLGGYGLIGQAIVRHLHGLGHEVVGLGRSVSAGKRAFAAIPWISADIADLTDARDWRPHLSGMDGIVNAAGALQDGLRDNLRFVHDKAIIALIDCAEASGVRTFVQISAPGAIAQASTAFMRTKAAGDAHLRESGLRWAIVKPGLVIGPNAYGGTALIRMLAGFPVILPLVHGDALIRTVALAEVADCVARALDGRLPERVEFELVEARPRSLRQIVQGFRQWLGVPPARAVIELPKPVGVFVAFIADGLGQLGWRSPLRSTAMQVLSEGIQGDPEPYRRMTGAYAASFEQTMLALPATLQERWFARLTLALPVMVAILSLFWLSSGLVGIWSMDQAAAALPADSVPPAAAYGLVLAGAAVDLALGAAILYRPWARRACFAMIAVTLAYLSAGTVLTPELWLDPFGAFVKAIPAATLAWVASLVLEER